MPKRSGRAPKAKAGPVSAAAASSVSNSAVTERKEKGDGNKLLSRDDFRNAVFKRDGFKCVICREPAVDAHHILERKLFRDGGYYLNNGASLCSACHLEAEKTKFSCKRIREAAGITEVKLPPDFDQTLSYDKWGNALCYGDDDPMSTRRCGPMFYLPNVQKILKQANLLDMFYS